MFEKNQSRFHQMITSFIVTQVMGPKEKEKIRDAFEALDTDKNGVLTQDEIINSKPYSKFVGSTLIDRY